MNDPEIKTLVKDTSKLFIKNVGFEDFWICYPDEDNGDWWIVKCLSKEDAEFVLDALTLHYNNFLV